MAGFLGFFATINLFIGIVNLAPLLPLDGGHVVIATYERIRSRRGRRYQVDVMKLLPLTYFVILLLGVLFVSTVFLDLVDPITNQLMLVDGQFPRRTTRQIVLRHPTNPVAVGGDAPISVQSMTITKTADVDGTLAQIYALYAAGADIVRCTCNEIEAAEGWRTSCRARRCRSSPTSTTSTRWRWPRSTPACTACA